MYVEQSWTCVPNSNRVQLLAPAWDENVCPHWAERWEIRTRPLGCQVSTITTLTSFVTIASTLVFALLVTLTVFGIQRLRAYSDKSPGLWKAWANAWKDWWAKWQQQRYPMIHGNEDDVEAREQGGNEREPLLPS